MPRPTKSARARLADRIGLGIVLVGTAAVIAVSCSFVNQQDNKPPLTPAEQARGACSVFIERAAHDPGSIEHVEYPSWPITQQSADTWGVTARYRATNPLGNRQLHTTTCVVRSKGDEWALVRLHTR